MTESKDGLVKEDPGASLARTAEWETPVPRDLRGSLVSMEKMERRGSLELQVLMELKELRETQENLVTRELRERKERQEMMDWTESMERMVRKGIPESSEKTAQQEILAHQDCRVLLV